MVIHGQAQSNENSELSVMVTYCVNLSKKCPGKLNQYTVYSHKVTVQSLWPKSFIDFSLEPNNCLQKPLQFQKKIHKYPLQLFFGHRFANSPSKNVTLFFLLLIGCCPVTHIQQMHQHSCITGCYIVCSYLKHSQFCCS